MRILTVSGTRGGGTFPDGTAAPPMPQNYSIQIGSIAAVSLSPTYVSGKPNVIETQLVSAQLVGGMSLPLMVNNAPNNAVNRQKIEQKYADLLADLADDTKLVINWPYEELT
jgi:hypothetical protein